MPSPGGGTAGAGHRGGTRDYSDHSDGLYSFRAWGGAWRRRRQAAYSGGLLTDSQTFYWGRPRLSAATTGQQAAEPAVHRRNSSALPRRRTERRVMYRSNIRNIHTLTSYLTSWRSDRLGIYGHAFVSANFASALLAWQRSYTELDGRTPRPQKLLI